MIFDFYKKSLRNKLLSIFIIIGFLPFFILLVYTLFLSENKIANKIIVEQFDRTEVVIKQIDNHINALQKEINFLGSLELMDDLLADDIDKRISRLLTQKAEDLNLQLTFFVVGEDSIIIASSDKEYLQKTYDLKKEKELNNSIYIEDTLLYICSKINASFDATKTLGTLVLQYNLKNLDLFLTHQDGVHSYIINPKIAFLIGEELALDVSFANDENSIINHQYVVVYKHLLSILQDWYIVYAVDKSVALEFLYDFMRFMLYISVLIIALIIYLSVKHSKEIVKPIEELTTIINDITTTHNYSKRIEVTSQDEIAILTHSFNHMLQTTSSALNELEEENKRRLKRFTQLIEIFNTIIQTISEEECMDVSIQEIKKLTDKENLYFVKDRGMIDTTKYIDLYVTDFENQTKIYFGSIELGINTFADKNEKDFYNSIASMITLQLDRIRLIQRTLSVSNAKSAFISNMSHELRTPLNAIIGFAQFMIAYEELNEEQQDTLGNIESSAQYLLSMINEILDIAKIEAGKMEAHMKDIDVLELLQETYDMLSPLAYDKDLKFEFIFNNFKPENYYTDPKMLKQIVINLISNAIKFTQEGTIVLELANDDKNLKISIQDTGIGIDNKDIPQLFNDFTQVENVMQKKHKGTGLGLSISKKMAEILGANIQIYSKGLGCGTKTTLLFTKISK